MSPKFVPTPIRHSTKKPKTFLGSTLRFLLASFSVLLLASVGTVGAYALMLQNTINNNSVQLETQPEIKTDDSAEGSVQTQTQVTDFVGGANILLVGSDSGGGNAAYGERGGALNDVNILLHIAADHSTATAISIPRDTYVAIPACTDPSTGNSYEATSGKINSALGRGGLSCVVQTIEELTGASIPYAAMVEFDGVINLSNAVGGVPVCITEPIEDGYSGANFAAGENVLQGADALAFLRTRHGVGDGSDLGRISNQQVFLSSLVRVLKSDATLTNPAKIFAVANVVANNMTLSTSLTDLNTIVSLAVTLKKIPIEEINFIQFPTVYTGQSGPQSLMTNVDALAVLMDSVLNDRLIDITGQTAPGGVGSTVQGDVPAENVPADPNAPRESAVLPDSITGQKASQVTCSTAN